MSCAWSVYLPGSEETKYAWPVALLGCMVIIIRMRTAN